VARGTRGIEVNGQNLWSPGSPTPENAGDDLDE
jgi:hypothetical protein